MFEVDGFRIGAVFGEFDLDQVFGGAVWTATHGSAFAAEGGYCVGVVDPPMICVFGLVFQALQSSCFSGLGDVL